MAQDVSATIALERLCPLCAQADLVRMGCTALLHANKGHRALAIACIALSAALQTLLSISVLYSGSLIVSPGMD